MPHRTLTVVPDYTISSNFEFVPNQVIMRSADLRTFELVSHIAERMDSSPAYNIAKSTPTTEKAYGKGFWASSIKQRPSDKMFCTSSMSGSAPQGSGLVHVLTSKRQTSPAVKGQASRPSSTRHLR